MFKRLLQITVLSLVISITSKLSFAYRPLGTEDAGVAGKGVSQLELSLDYLKWNGDKEQVFLFVPIYGVTDNLELSLEVPYLVHDFKENPSNDGIGDINIVAKYLLIQEGDKNPAFTVKGVVKLDNGDYNKGLGSGDKDYSLFAVFSKSFKDLTLHAQLGYTLVGDEKDENLRNIFLYGFAFDYGVTETFHIVGEINGNRHPDSSEPKDPRIALIGLTYKLSEKVILDAAFKKGLTSSTSDWGTTVGASITF